MNNLAVNQIQSIRGASVGKWYSVKEAAKLLGAAPSTVRKWIKDDDDRALEDKFFPNLSSQFPWVPGSPYRISEEDIENLLKKRKD